MLGFPDAHAGDPGPHRSGAAGSRVTTRAAGRRDPSQPRSRWPSSLAACGPTIPPIPLRAPTPSRPPDRRRNRARVRSSRAPIRRRRRAVRRDEAARRRATPPTAANSSGSCDQGRLDRRLRAVPARRRVPGQGRVARLRHQRHGLAALAHHDPAGSAGPADRRPGQRHRTVPARDRGTTARRSASPATTAYWGTAAKNERLIVRWGGDSATRVSELQNGTVDGIDDIDPAGVETVAGDVSLRAEPRAGQDVVYLGFDADRRSARQRAGPAGDRRRHRPRDTSSTNDFPPGAEVATHYTPCDIPHGCAGGDWYEYDPTQARETARRGRLSERLRDDDLTTARRRRPRCRTRAGSRPRSRPSCIDQPRDQGGAGRHARRRLPRRRSTTGSPRRPPPRSSASVTYPDPAAYPRSPLRCRARRPNSVRRSRTSPRRSRAAARRSRPASAKRPTPRPTTLIRQPRPDDPDRPGGRPDRLPRRRRWRGGVSARARTVRGDDPRRSTPARLADDRASRPVCTAPTRPIRSPGSSARS